MIKQRHSLNFYGIKKLEVERYANGSVTLWLWPHDGKLESIILGKVQEIEVNDYAATPK